MEKELTRIMYIKMDDGHVDGVFKTDGYIDGRRFLPQMIAKFIYESLVLVLRHN